MSAPGDRGNYTSGDPVSLSVGILLNVTVAPVAVGDDDDTTYVGAKYSVDPSYTSGNFAVATDLIGLMLTMCLPNSLHLPGTSDA